MLICGALISRETSSSGISIKDAQFQSNDSVCDPVNISGKSLKFVAEQNLKQFFDELELEKSSLEKVCSYAQPFLNPDGSMDLMRLSNIPQVRNPGTEWSQPIFVKKYIQKISKSVLAARKNEKRPVVLKKGKVALLYTHNIDVTTEIEDKSAVMLSILEGLDLHLSQEIFERLMHGIDGIIYFEAIKTNLGFLELVNNVLSSTMKAFSYLDNKIILIKELECKNDIKSESQTLLITGQVTGQANLLLHNVLLVNKTPDPVEETQTNDLTIYFKNEKNEYLKGEWKDFATPMIFLYRVLSEKGISQQQFSAMEFNAKLTLQGEIMNTRVKTMETQIPKLETINVIEKTEKYEKIYSDLVEKIKKYD